MSNKMAEVVNERALRAANVIKDYCEKRDCRECVFWIEKKEDMPGSCALDQEPWKYRLKTAIRKVYKN